jgi:xanthine dehydrogenase YagR molybdenum-binding subunit
LQVHRGDVAAALSAAAADAKIDVTYTTPMENHNPIETYSTTVEWEASDRLVVHDATRGIKQLQRIVANAFGLPLESVRVISPFVGGAFGSKGFQWSHVLLAVAAAQLVRRPVRLTLTRPQMFDSAGQRAQTAQTFSIAASNDGKLTALRHAILTHCSPVSEYTEACGNMSPILYSCPNIEVSYRLVKLNYTTPCPMRAPGEAPGVFALECALDELAYKLGIDPLDFRLRNYAEKNEYQNKLWSSKRLRECYARGAEKFGWSRRLPQPRSMLAADGALLGWGMATAVYPATQRPAGAKATLTADGRVVIRSATHEIGTGTYTTMTQLAAEALGLPMESIRFELGDSEYPDAPNNGGSWQTSSIGPAVLAVCDEVKRKLIDLAINGANAPFAGAAREEILAQNGMLILKQNASRNIGFGDLLARAGQSRLEAESKTAVDKATREEFSFQSFGAIFVEVRVDPSLGQPRVTRVVGVYDLGRILNPRLARSQLLGGTLFGIGNGADGGDRARPENRAHRQRESRGISRAGLR